MRHKKIKLSSQELRQPAESSPSRPDSSSDTDVGDKSRISRRTSPVDFSRAVGADRTGRYEVNLLDGLLQENAAVLAECIGTRKTLMVTTPTVGRLYGPRLQTALREHGVSLHTLVLACDENAKTLDQVERVCRDAYRLGLDRKSVLIGFGGGVCTDIVTLAASWIRRGISHIRIPTSLIGQIDASIGVKGAVNFCGKKSALGCFYAPESVWIDPVFLRTLEPQPLSCGLAESIKMALVRDRGLFELVEEHAEVLIDTAFAEPKTVATEVIWRSVLRMLEELETNLFEDKTYERLVDFGHTFSPLLESSSGFRIPHGEAVAIDIALSCVIARELDLLDGVALDRVLAALIASRLPIYSPLLTTKLCLDVMQDIVRHRGGALNLVLPTSIGRATFLRQLNDLPEPVIQRAISRLAERQPELHRVPERRRAA